MKKKRFRFSASLTLYELSDVPFVSGVLFVKVKLGDGGSFSAKTARQAISNHTVTWNEEFTFECRMTAPASDGILSDCMCRLFIRMETKGGKSYEKLGYVDINLAQYACAGLQTTRMLLLGNSNAKKQDNSVLKVGVNVNLLSGDPCFKKPELVRVKLTDAFSSSHTEAAMARDMPAGGANPLSVSGSSHVHQSSASGLLPPLHSRQASQGSGCPSSSHSRQASQTSTISMSSRPHSGVHSRTPSFCEEDKLPASAGSRLRKPSDILLTTGKRSDVPASAEAVVDQIINNQSVMEGDETDGHNGAISRSSLQLFVSPSGQATVSGTDIRFSGGYKPVIMTGAQ
ncbi:early estrogen-induced gene 1 protein-like [Corticium candelabrum]|uniref:early estrogen-induced gene 1 protein-like n=1 Tax=Corticium candelabrum TaxID=121492 RepID=UPI002E26E63A|nr:early estrogen-induced gene 1 protein-like [Corticium candelabrum]